MADLHIEREHHLGLSGAREISRRWVDQAVTEFGMECTSEEGPAEDLVSFSRSGVSGTLKVSADRFDLQARLGFLLGAFKDRIEAEIVRNLDALLAQQSAKDLKIAQQGAPDVTPGA